jgi:hypothetical protein
VHHGTIARGATHADRLTRLPQTRKKLRIASERISCGMPLTYVVLGAAKPIWSKK